MDVWMRCFIVMPITLQLLGIFLRNELHTDIL